VDYVLIPEGFLKDRIKRLAQKIYIDYTNEGIEQLDLLVIMNSAFKYFTNLIDELNKHSETPGCKRLKIVPHFVKVTSQALNV